jgi:hypothetical protein
MAGRSLIGTVASTPVRSSTTEVRRLAIRLNWALTFYQGRMKCAGSSRQLWAWQLW